MDNQQKQFLHTHTTNINTLNKIAQKAMGMNIEQITRINRGQSIDWGAVHSGDPVRDFVRWNYWDNYEFSIDWLASTYGQSLVTSQGFEERLKLARIIDALLLLDTSTCKFPDAVDAKHAALVIRDIIK